MKRFWLMGRFEIKVVGALALVAIGIFAVSLVLVRDLLNVATTMARNQSQELVAELGRAAEYYRSLVEAQKRVFKETAYRYTSEVVSKLRQKAGQAGSLGPLFSEWTTQDPMLGRIRLLDSFGRAILDVEKKGTSDKRLWRRVTLKRSLTQGFDPHAPTGPRRLGNTLEMTFLFSRRLDSEYQRLGQLIQQNPHLRRLDVAMQPQSYRLFLIWFSVAILGVTVIGLVLSRRLTRRVTLLSRATSQVAAGDLDVAVPVKTRDELGQLAEAFNQMVRQIKQSRTQIAYLQKISAWQEIARRLAHEIKNPLTPIQLAMQQVHDMYEGDDARFRKTLEDASEIVREEVDTLRLLVEEFSAFAKLPQVSPAPEPVNGLIDDFVRSLTGLQDSEMVDWKHTDPNLGVMVDRMQFRRVLHNLVDNAIQAAKAESIPPKIVIRARSMGRLGQVEFTVDDNGPGIPVDMRERIFDPYVTTKPDGTGLGLAIVKKIMLEHRGSIEVQTSPLGGTRMLIRLPRA